MISVHTNWSVVNVLSILNVHGAQTQNGIIRNMTNNQILMMRVKAILLLPIQITAIPKEREGDQDVIPNIG